MMNKLSKVISKIQEKSERFNAQMETLDREIKITEREMEQLNDELVELQLEGDPSGETQRIKKKLKELALRLEEQDSIKESYKRVAKKGLVGDKERREIKSIIDKSSIIRRSNLEKTTQEKERVLQEIESLQSKVKGLEARYDREHGEKERELRELESIAIHIDPSAAQLNHYQKRPFIQHWLAGGNTQQFLKEPARSVAEVIDLGPKKEVAVKASTTRIPDRQTHYLNRNKA